MRLLSKLTSLQSPSFLPTTFQTLPGRSSLLLGVTLVLVKRQPRYSSHDPFVTWSREFIHRERAQVLLVKNAKVYIATRSEERAKAAIDDLKQTTGKEAIWLKLDLSSLKSVKAAANEFLEYVRGEVLAVKL